MVRWCFWGQRSTCWVMTQQPCPCWSARTASIRLMRKPQQCWRSFARGRRKTEPFSATLRLQKKREGGYCCSRPLLRICKRADLELLSLPAQLDHSLDNAMANGVPCVAEVRIQDTARVEVKVQAGIA